MGNDAGGAPRTVVSSDGTRIGVVEYGSPHVRQGNASVLFVPALGVPVGYYSNMLTRWSQAGRHIVGVELRGMPLTPVSHIRQQRFGYSTLINDDLPAVATDAFTGSTGFIVVGHSLGGQLAVLATAAKSIKPVALATIASGTSSSAAHATSVRRAARRGQVAFVRGVSAALGYWPGDRLGFGGRQPRNLMRDWCHEGTFGRYRLHDDGTDYEAALNTITQPILMLSLADDPIIGERAVDHLRRRLPGTVEHRRLETSAPGGFEHIRWARQQPQPVIDAIEAWSCGNEQPKPQP